MPAFPDQMTIPPIAKTRIMHLVARVAKGFGAGSPLLLANRYGLFRPDFSLSPEEMILGDNHLLNELIKAENEAQKEAMKKSKEKRDHPGVERFGNEDEFWDESTDANEEARQKP